MRRRRCIGFLVLLATMAACERPDAERDGFVVVDEAARAAGIGVDVAGERHEGALPVAVPEGSDAALVRAAGAEPLLVEPGELVQIVGADGEVRRSAVPRDAIEVSGERDAVFALAEMIDARVLSTGGGRHRLSGADAFVLATLMGRVPGITGVFAPATRPDGGAEEVLDVAFVLGADGPSLPRLEAGTGPVPEAASLVGYYTHGPAALLLDAAGGYTIYQGERVAGRGRFRPRAGGVDFLPEDGTQATSMALEGQRLVDGVGLRLAPVEAPRPEPRTRPHPLGGIFHDQATTEAP